MHLFINNPSVLTKINYKINDMEKGLISNENTCNRNLKGQL